jgi:hypothetical protein
VSLVKIQCDEQQHLKGEDDFSFKVYPEAAGHYKFSLELDQFNLTSHFTNERKDVFRDPEFK